ncbi:IMPACT family protein [Moraxella equi]|uniref:IMPACT family member yigZ n=1 Tax=Moraxella equi TaxID=60442 RepID=A0A378QWT7_9GAMM|nr:YigZ family protein [Moraxella equi]MDO5050544.1 YigZ family protein [Moraxella equi]OPH40093.1 IMPACT family protein [Moraxella equi]STZ03893.1 IMPACT family member yigZ [Moraxella equi]
MTYATLSAPCQAVYEIKKSEFLAFAYPISHKDEVMFHVEQLRERYPDARHHCVAYILGDPHNTTHAGFDDDGEPNGTAGRPILNVLQHKAIGNVLVVVVRYFGGIKLGAGGLTRAYATTTQMVVDKMELVPFVPKSQLEVATTFAHEAQIRYLVGQAGGEILGADYAHNVVMSVELDSEKVDEFGESLGVFGELLREE